MALNLTGAFSDMGNLLGSVSGQNIAENLLLGAGTTLILSGAKTDAGQDAVDPLHWFHHKDTGNSGVVQGPVMVASQFAKLDPATQQTLLNAHYTIIPG
jgi:hypothetical protein